MKSIFPPLAALLLLAGAASLGQEASPSPAPSASPSPSPSPTPSADEKAVLQLELDWCDALAKHDADFLQRALAEEYRYTDPAGRVSGKADELARAKTGDVQIDSFHLSDEKVQIYGETAVMTGETAIKGKDNGGDITGDYRWTDLFVKRGGNWQVVASQATVIQVEDD